MSMVYKWCLEYLLLSAGKVELLVKLQLKNKLMLSFL